MMKIIKQAFFSMLLLKTTFCHAQTPQYEARRVRPVPVVCDADTLSKVVGDETLQIWATADSIESFILEGWYHDTTAKGLNGFQVKKVGPILKTAKKARFVQIVKNPQSYLWDGYAKHCTFVPNIGFRARKDSAIVTILMSLSCDVWHWYTPSGERVPLEADPAHDSIRLFASQIWGRENYISVRPPKTMEHHATVNTDAIGDSAAVQYAPRQGKTPFGTSKSIQIEAENSKPNHFSSVKPRYYTVLEGETLYRISQRYHVSLAQLKEWNHLKNDKIKMGQKLIIGFQ